MINAKLREHWTESAKCSTQLHNERMKSCMTVKNTPKPNCLFSLPGIEVDLIAHHVAAKETKLFI